jgi:hypothetical protein
MNPIPSEEQVKKFLNASDDLMKLGIAFSRNIDSAFREFKQDLEMMTKTDFVEKAVVEMLSDSFERMEAKVKANLENIVSIYQEGGQWYSFYLSRAIGKRVGLPLTGSDPGTTRRDLEREKAEEESAGSTTKDENRS